MGKLFEIFKTEVEEHLGAISRGLLRLEKQPPDSADLLEQLFREAHTLKGAARSINQMDVESLAASLENAFAVWKKTDFQPGREIFGLFYKALDLIDALLAGRQRYEDIRAVTDQLDAVEFRFDKQPGAGEEKSQGETKTEKEAEGKKPEKPTISETAAGAEMEPYTAEQSAAVKEPAYEALDHGYAQGRDFLTGMVKVHAEQVNELMGEAEEMIAEKAYIEENLGVIGELLQRLNSIQKDIALFNGQTASPNAVNGGVGTGIASGAIPTAGISKDFAGGNVNSGREELVDAMSLRIGSVHDQLTQRLDSVNQHFGSLSAMIQRHLDTVRQTGMEPFSTLADTLRHMARSLAGDQGKLIDVEISGEDIELDRRILQELRTPLLHLIRNAIDHGIETPDRRESSGKRGEGHLKVRLSALDNGRFSLVVEDDGAGIDPQAIKHMAVKRSVVSAEKAETMGKGEALDLVFSSGFSTRADVSALSGRGLGLAIVRESIRKLAGQVRVESIPGKCTRFTMQLPSSVYALRGILIEVGDREFILPTTFVDRVERIWVDTIKTVEGKKTISSKGETVALVELASVLGTGMRNRDMPVMPVIVISFAGNKLAFSVDRIIEESDYVVKPLGPQLARVRMITGAVVSGSGHSIPVLNITDMLLTERLQLSSVKRDYALEQEPQKHKVVLVVEDSVTSRTLLKAVLQSTGYTVKTAVDGADAYAMLKSESVDVVVSDIDMPRMNGLELTRKIRGDKDLVNLPVVLVSALDTRQDQEAGIEAGADAYIVKSRFDNADLINTVKRLV